MMEKASDEVPLFSEDDSVTIIAKQEYAAWLAPSYVALVVRTDNDGWTYSAPIPIDRVEGAVIDALADQWLKHLYASLGRPSPFVKGRAA